MICAKLGDADSRGPIGRVPVLGRGSQKTCPMLVN